MIRFKINSTFEGFRRNPPQLFYSRDSTRRCTHFHAGPAGSVSPARRPAPGRSRRPTALQKRRCGYSRGLLFSFLFRKRDNSYTGLLAQKIKKPQQTQCLLRDGATLRGTTHIRPFGRPSAAITACSLTRKTAELTPFGPAARGRPSPAASRALAPSALSLCISRQVLLPFIAIWIHYSLGLGFCQQLFKAAP